MTSLSDIYRPSLALLTDLYQLTMAYGYWKLGKAEQSSIFHLFFRRNPFAGGYAIAAGLQPVVDLIEQFKFQPDDLEYLAGICGNDDKPLFESAFLDYLSELRPTLDVDAVPEGTIVFPHEPLLRIQGPILQCQLLETPLLNVVNFQSLIATKAARICHATAGEPVLEFGLRRAQGIDGGLAASRAAYIGGCAATSNVFAGKLFGIPVKGTHSHSWVMSFDSETDAFKGYAEVMPNNCVFLVDTYDTIEGVRRAIEVGRELQQDGHKMVGIRLDSGDLAYLSMAARSLLDEAGFSDVAIVASNDLDERIIASLKNQGAQISVWGVGTKLVTGDSQPALGGVYKLAAVQEDNGTWTLKVKLSEQLIKTSTPGKLQVRRLLNDAGHAVADMIYNELEGLPDNPQIVDPMDPTRRRDGEASTFVDLLAPTIRNGKAVWARPSLATIRERTFTQLAMFHSSVLRHDNPHSYPVGLEHSLFNLKSRLIMTARGVASSQ